jgi:uncharacterized membrane protein YagU involved in acid resistance
MNSALAGAIGGIVATYAMTRAMAHLKSRLPGHEREALPPRLVTEGALHEVLPARTGEETWRNLSLASHFAFGAAAGAARATIGKNGTVAGGVVYGLSVWTASYLGWVPALGIMPPATHQPWKRNLVMLAAHVVWGASLTLVTRQLLQSEKILMDERPDAGSRQPAAPAISR